MRCEVNLPAVWIDASMMETAIQRAGDPDGAGVYEVAFRFSVGSKLMIDAAIRLLSLANQLAATSQGSASRSMRAKLELWVISIG